MWNNISRLRHIQYIKERERKKDVVSPAQFSENGPSDLYILPPRGRPLVVPELLHQFSDRPSEGLPVHKDVYCPH